MNIDDRNKRMAEIFEECLALSRRKGQDYAGEQDSLANLRIFGFKGILIRLFDKLMRLKSIEESGKMAVKDESVKDTLMDTLVYSALAMILLEDEEMDRVIKKGWKHQATAIPADELTDPTERALATENWDEKVGK